MVPGEPGAGATGGVDGGIGLNGRKTAPCGSATTANRPTVGMSVGGRQKVILVTGDRVWQRGQPSNPKPFESMPLVWERAFGGVHRNGDKAQAEDRNPVGCGLMGGRSADDMEGMPVPNLEDPAAPLQQVGQTPAPACFAPIAPSWLPPPLPFPPAPDGGTIVQPGDPSQAASAPGLSASL